MSAVAAVRVTRPNHVTPPRLLANLPPPSRTGRYVVGVARNGWAISLTTTARSIRWQIEWTPPLKPYGDLHRVLRDLIESDMLLRHSGCRCAERVCVRGNRSIGWWQEWHLAHDHRGGPADYLGPAHPECNGAERGTRRLR
jgi:hypothetical protein